ncbi:MAG: fused MFS/spermidine synthase, partial [Zoogloea sp.]|nr:fused MFS/spermidine synthase [Zoogloea sp.]
MKHTAPLHLPFGPDAALVLNRRQAPRLVPGRLQSIAVEDTHAFGTLYSLDGDAMAAEADEFMLHESLVHIPALCHPDPRRALVLGGGDGASARELLKHPGLGSIVVAELDPEVVATVRAHLPALPQAAFNTGRVDLRIGDAAHTLASAYQAGERFDVILFDLTEADDPACAHLHQPDFLQLCAASLAPRGIIHVQLGSPFYQPEKVASLYRRLGTVFPELRVRLIHVPLYGGPWLLACCSGNTL